MNGGGSQSQLVLGSDKKQYVVKLMGNGQGTRILANEYVVGRIAEILDAQSPPVTTIEVDAVMVANMNKVSNAHFQAGIQFAQLYVGGSDTVFPSNPELMAKAGNIGNWPNAIVLDALTQNDDFKAVHVLVESAKQGGGCKFWHIDHGHCLGITAGWGTLSPSKATIRNLLYGDLVAGVDPFGDVFTRMNAITMEQIEGILAGCPLSAWQVPNTDSSNLVKYLLEARKPVQNTILSAKPQFPNWK
jgi:fibronectin type 3 domain-containing protein